MLFIRLLVSFVFLVQFWAACGAQGVQPKEKAVLSSVLYTGDVVSNLSGGIKTGSVYLGMAGLTIDVDLGKCSLWRGGRFFIYGANIHGKSPSDLLVGDHQMLSNIDGGNHTYFQELWLSQTFGRMEFTAGLQDLNVEFANSDFAVVFMNSSFGILPIISNNFSAPIFPLTTFGVTAKWQVSESFSLLGALYDGSPTDFDYNPYNIKWHLGKGDGLLAITEAQWHNGITRLKGNYKIGFYSHNHMLDYALKRSLPDSLQSVLTGFYGYFDQNVWQQNSRSLGLFLQIGYSPSAQSTNNYYLGLGLNLKGVFLENGTDVFGVALAHEHLKTQARSESIVEMFYRYNAKKHYYVQPDLQYIINPSGTGSVQRNALVASFRFGLTF